MPPFIPQKLYTQLLLKCIHTSWVHIIFHKVFFTISTRFPPLHETLYVSQEKVFVEVSERGLSPPPPVFRMAVVSKKGVPGLHPSRNQKNGSRSVLNWERGEDKVEYYTPPPLCKD